jgi:pSer/pThr/pTyr-binding forkhead associated (FHA) protein
MISKKHCCLFIKQSQFADEYRIYAEDLSSNGTFINGNPIGREEVKMLTDGDELSLVTPT